MNKENLKSLIYNLLLPIFLNFIVLMLIPNLKEYYNSLTKPKPNISFLLYLIIFSINYILSGLSAYIIENIDKSNETLKLYYYNLFISLLLTIILFWIKSNLISIFTLVLILTMSIYIYFKFKKMNKTASYFYIPNILLNAFFTYYVIGILILN